MKRIITVLVFSFAILLQSCSPNDSAPSKAVTPPVTPPVTPVTPDASPPISISYGNGFYYGNISYKNGKLSTIGDSNSKDASAFYEGFEWDGDKISSYGYGTEMEYGLMLYSDNDTGGFSSFQYYPDGKLMAMSIPDYDSYGNEHDYRFLYTYNGDHTRIDRKYDSKILCYYDIWFKSNTEVEVGKYQSITSGGGLKLLYTLKLTIPNGSLFTSIKGYADVDIIRDLFYSSTNIVLDYGSSVEPRTAYYQISYDTKNRITSKKLITDSNDPLFKRRDIYFQY